MSPPPGAIEGLEDATQDEMGRHPLRIAPFHLPPFHRPPTPLHDFHDLLEPLLVASAPAEDELLSLAQAHDHDAPEAPGHHAVLRREQLRFDRVALPAAPAPAAHR